MTKVFSKVVLLLAGGLLLLMATSVSAQGPQGVRWTKHNFSAESGTFGAEFTPYATDEDEICVFCHTPHGGVLVGPLWNRSQPAINDYTHYNSATLSSQFQGNQSRPLNDESFLCMSCHDGSIAVNRILNPTNDLGQMPTKGGGGSDAFIPQTLPAGFELKKNPAHIGNSPSNLFAVNDLTDDHPVSFSYYNSATEDNELEDPTTILTKIANGDPMPQFFGAGAVPGGMRVECSTCHDPHVYYDPTIPGIPGDVDASYTPFLAMPNTGSQMCLTCHLK